jgi:hypothetical protein
MRIIGRLSLKTPTLAPVLALGCALLLPTPARPADAGQDFAAFEKIDVHVHLYGEMPEFARRAKEDGFRVLTINVVQGFPPPRSSARRGALQRAYPDRIASRHIRCRGQRRPGWLAHGAISRDALGQVPSRSRCGRTSACSSAMPMAARS